MVNDIVERERIITIKTLKALHKDTSEGSSFDSQHNDYCHSIDETLGLLMTTEEDEQWLHNYK